MVAVALLARERGEPHAAPSAAVELADGVALSNRSFWRTTSSFGVLGGGVQHRRGRRPRTSRAWCRPSRGAASTQRASPVSSASRWNASTSAAWSAASASWRAGGVPSACQRAVPAAVVAVAARGAGTRRWRSRPASSRRAGACAAASASAPRNSAFHSVSTLSSRPGRGRCALASNRRWRARLDLGRPCELDRDAWSRFGIDRPSKLPASVMPNHSSAAVGALAEDRARPRRASTCGTGLRARGRARRASRRPRPRRSRRRRGAGRGARS